MKKFSDFSDEKILEGNKVKIEDILNKEVKIIGFRISNSKYKDKDYLTLQIFSDNETSVVFTGSEVLIDQIKRYQKEIPFLSTVRKINKYYSLT